jgi:hypothetical protein
MRVDQFDMFSQDDCPEVREKSEEIGQCRGGGDGNERDVIYLKSREEPSYTNSVWSMSMCDNDDLR